MNKQTTQWVAGGVLIGVLVTLGAQYGIKSYETAQTNERVEIFATGLKSAQDKTAFTKDFLSRDTSKAKIEFATSSASNDDPLCQGLFDQMLEQLGWLDAFRESFRQTYTGPNNEDAMWDAYENHPTRRDIWDAYNSIDNIWRELGCAYGY